MKRPFFSFGIYKDSLRQLRLAGIFLTALTSVLVCYTPIMTLLGMYPGFYALAWISWPIELIPFVAAPILILLPLHFQNRRADSDFYHALPMTKTALTASRFAASVTWCAVVAFVPSLLLTLLSVIPPHTPWNVLGNALLLKSGAAFVASLYVMVIVVLSASLCGKTFSTLCTAFVLLAAPRLITYTVSSLLLDQCVVLPPDSGRALLDGISQNLLGGNASDPTTWLVTGLKFLIVGVLALWASSKRPSEIAERSALSPALHVVFRTLLATLLCLPSITTLVQTEFSSLASAIFWYILALAAYYLYEVLTTRSAKSLWKATLWLPLVVAINVLVIGGVNLGAQLITNTCPTAEEIDSVSLSRIVYRLNHDGYIRETGYGYRPETADYYDSQLSENVFFNVSKNYALSEGTRVALTDEESHRIISEALARYIKEVGAPSHSIYNSDLVPLESLVGDRGIVYLADVQIRDGWFTHDRRIALTEEELKALVKKIDKQAKLPLMMDSIFTYDLYQGCTHYSEETGLDGGNAEVGFDEDDPTSYFHIRDEENTVWVATEHLVSAEAVYEDYGTGSPTPVVRITLTEDGAALLHEASLKNFGKTLSVCYGENVLYAPVVNEPLNTPEILLNGSFSTLRDAEGFADLLNSLIEGRR